MGQSWQAFKRVFTNLETGKLAIFLYLYMALIPVILLVIIFELFFTHSKINGLTISIFLLTIAFFILFYKLIRTINILKNQLKLAHDCLAAQEKLASLGVIAAGIAHEIKNHLNFVNNFSLISLTVLTDLKEEILHDIPLTPEEIEKLSLLKQNIHSIFEQGKKADNIVQRMLSHSASEKEIFSETNINQLISDYLDLSLYSITSKKFPITIEKRLNANFATLEVISEDIGRVLINIFNNAFYAMKKKHEFDHNHKSLLIVETMDISNGIEIKIRDNGAGMSEDISKKIFTPFFTTKPAGEGTGLGLYLSYNVIVKKHKGELEFQTEEGKFTEFIIRLFNNLQAK